MLRVWLSRTLCVATLALGVVASSWGQAPAPAPAATSPAATPAGPGNDNSEAFIGIPGFVFGSSTIAGQSLSTTGSLGIAAGLRLHMTKHQGFEFQYSYSSNTHNYLPTWSEQAHLYEFTGNYVYTIPTGGKMQYYGLVGLSAMNFGLTSNSANFGASSTGVPVTSQTKLGVDYGVGADRKLTETVSLRFELREISYKAPDFGIGTATGVRFTNWSQLTQPTIGIVYHF